MGGQVGGGGVGFGGGGFRVDVNGEVKLCENSKKNFFLGGWGLGQGGGGVGLGGQGGWERKSEACVKIQKKKIGG